ncbi:MAG: SH3 domain-containing protein [Bacteroidia bacterium]
MFRYTFLIITLLILLLFGCGSDQDESRTEGQTITETESPESISDKSALLSTSQAIIATGGVRSRSGPSVQDGIIRSFELGEIVTVTDSTKDRFAVTEGDECDGFGYRWYRVKDADQKESWVFGKFLYHILAPGERHYAIGQSIQIGQKTWYFGAAVEESYGPSDSEGLTGCDMRFLPFFYEKNAGTVHPVYYDRTIVRSNDLERYEEHFGESVLLLNQMSEGGSVTINEISQDNVGSVDVNLQMELFYQEGTAEGTLSLREDNGTFNVVNFTKTQ